MYHLFLYSGNDTTKPSLPLTEGNAVSYDSKFTLKIMVLSSKFLMKFREVCDPRELKFKYLVDCSVVGNEQTCVKTGKQSCGSEYRSVLRKKELEIDLKGIKCAAT